MTPPEASAALGAATGIYYASQDLSHTDTHRDVFFCGARGRGDGRGCINVKPVHANHEVRLEIDAKRRFAGRFVGPHCGNSESQSASRHISNAEPMWIWPEPDTASFQKSPSEIKWQTCARYSMKEKL